MHSLNDLLRALITVIIRYHQSQDPMSAKALCEPSLDFIYGQKDGEVPAPIGSGWTEIPLGDHEQKSTTQDRDRQEKEWIDQLLLESTTEFKETLSNMIQGSTQHIATRRSLLDYLLHVILTLRQHETLSSLAEEANARLVHSTLVDFLKQLQLLYRMNPYQSLLVTFEENSVQIFGLGGFLTQTKSKIARNIDELVMTPLNIKQTTEESTIHLHIECFILRKKVDLLSSAVSQKTASTHEKQEASIISSDIDTNTFQMAEQLALQAKEIERLNGLLRQTATLPRASFTGPFRLFGNGMNIGVAQAITRSELGDGLKKL